MIHWLSTALVAAFIALHAIPSNAQTACGDRAKILTYLADQYSERSVAMGLMSTGKVMELLTSSAGSWTILVTMPGGPTCVIAAGESWEELPVPTSEPIA